MGHEPLTRSKEDYEEIIEKISSGNSPVGIDAQFTHAIIIEYLRHIDGRLQNIENKIANPGKEIS